MVRYTWFAGSLFCALFALQTHATNANLQDFLFQVCASANGSLAARCAETDGGLGNVSGDSESSLNPSQVLNVNASSLAVARERAEQARRRAERLEDDTENSKSSASRWSFLINGHHGGLEFDRAVDVDLERSFEEGVVGLDVGLDYRLSDRALFGALVSFQNAELEFDREEIGRNFTPASSAGEIDTSALGFTLFGVFNPVEDIYVDAAIGVSSGEVDISRNSVFQESNRVIAQTNVNTSADADQRTVWGSLNAGVQYTKGAWSLSTYSGVNFSSTQTDGFSEVDRGGSGLAMLFEDIDQDSLVAMAGVHVQRAYATRSGVILPQLRIEYHHEFEDEGADTVAQYLLDTGNNALRLEGDSRDSSYFSVGAGVSWILPNGWLPFIQADVELGYADRERYRITAGLRKEL